MNIDKVADLIIASHARISDISPGTIEMGEEDCATLNVTALVDGKQTDAKVAFGPLPWPEHYEEVMARGLNRAIVDSLLMQRSVADGNPTYYEDGEPVTTGA